MKNLYMPNLPGLRSLHVILECKRKARIVVIKVEANEENHRYSLLLMISRAITVYNPKLNRFSANPIKKCLVTRTLVLVSITFFSVFMVIYIL